MARLIDAEELKRDYCAMLFPRNRIDVLKVIDAQPTVTAESKHGRWLNMTKGIPLTEKQLKSYSFAGCCSVCRENSGTQYATRRFNFCPYCGAKMDGGAENGKID